MDLLKERIMKEGRCFPGGILKVDSFVNHQMDPILMMDLAKEFVRLFKDIKYNKIVTIEASGIAPAIMVGYLTNLPVVFVKKKQPKTMEGMITSVVHSFTKDRDYTVCVSNSYLTPKDHVIFIYDFLANGNASKGVMDLCEQAGAKIPPVMVGWSTTLYKVVPTRMNTSFVGGAACGFAFATPTG